jgi:hypothetical protein
MAKHKLRKKDPNARQRLAAVKHAEAQLERPMTGQSNAMLRPETIATRTELFQPRGFFHGMYELDNDHVKKLAREIRIKGELDPVLVVKLGGDWVCVDGHHRLEAYRKNKWSGTIKCRWFAGDVRQAVDESIRRNSIVKLEVPQPDKLEEAWKRTVLKWGSKADVVKLCGVSDGLVGMMRRVFAKYHATDEGAETFRARLGKRIDEARWPDARNAYLGQEKKPFNAHEEAARLARSLHSRLHDRLSRDPEITARALALYDTQLPGRLWQWLHTFKGGLPEDPEGGE